MVFRKIYRREQATLVHESIERLHPAFSVLGREGHLIGQVDILLGGTAPALRHQCLDQTANGHGAADTAYRFDRAHLSNNHKVIAESSEAGRLVATKLRRRQRAPYERVPAFPTRCRRPVIDPELNRVGRPIDHHVGAFDVPTIRGNALTVAGLDERLRTVVKDGFRTIRVRADDRVIEVEWIGVGRMD